MDRSGITDLLDRYSRGKTSAGEDLRIEDRLSGYHNAGNAWDKMDTHSRKQWLDSIWADVESSIGVSAKIVSTPGRMRFKPSLWRATASVAAILLICAGLWYLQSPGNNTSGVNTLTASATKAGQKKMIHLNDGSTVWLNAGSELKYPAGFSGATREVYLSGEAYFDIRHDDHKTFIVHTGEVTTTVLGTAFNIRENKKDHLVTVTVTRGKVSVSEGKRLLSYIMPNQQISYNTQNKAYSKNTVDVVEAIAWQSGDLRFDEISFAEAAKRLSERFGVKIIFANEKVAGCRFSGTVLSGKDIDQVLKVICAFNHADYRHNKDASITIDGKGCQ